MATAGTRWGVVMSRNAGFSDQVQFLELDNDILYIMLVLSISSIYSSSMRVSAFF